MTLPTPQYLNPPPKYQVLFVIADPGVPDADTLNPTLVLAARRFNPDRAPYVEFYWDVTPVALGDKATFKVLRWDGISETFIYVSTETDVPPQTLFRVATGSATCMAILATQIVAGGLLAANFTVHGAQFFLAV